MPDVIFRYQVQEQRVEAEGRNGVMQMGGVVVCRRPDSPRTPANVGVWPLTSRGARGRCDISLPVRDLGVFVAALLREAPEAAGDVAAAVQQAIQRRTVGEELARATAVTRASAGGNGTPSGDCER